MICFVLSSYFRKRLTAQECFDHPWIQKFSNEQELDANENVKPQEKYSNSSEISSLSVELVIQTEDNKGHSRNQKDIENKNVLDNRLCNIVSVGETKTVVEQEEESSATSGVRSGTLKEEHLSDMDVHMDCEIKDGHEVVSSESSKSHEESRKPVQSTKNWEAFARGCNRRASLPNISRKVASEHPEDLATMSSSVDHSPAIDRRCRNCNKLHPDAPSSSDRNLSPSSSPMGTRRALCPNKENLPQDIREPKRFCIEVLAQQPGQVVCWYRTLVCSLLWTLYFFCRTLENSGNSMEGHHFSNCSIICPQLLFIGNAWHFNG